MDSRSVISVVIERCISCLDRLFPKIAHAGRRRRARLTPPPPVCINDSTHVPSIYISALIARNIRGRAALSLLPSILVRNHPGSLRGGQCVIPTMINRLRSFPARRCRKCLINTREISRVTKRARQERKNLESQSIRSESRSSPAADVNSAST